MFQKKNANQKSVAQETNQNTEVKEPVYTHFALGSYRDPATQRWVLQEFKFNPETKEVEFGNKTEMQDGRVELNDRFKIRAAEIIEHYKY